MVEEVKSHMNIAELVRFLKEHPAVPPREVATRLHVSPRTLRSYVSHANDSLRGIAHIEVERGVGYHLDVLDSAQFDAWLASNSGESSHLAVKTPAERVDYLLNDLLVRTDWIKLKELSNVLYVSKSSLSSGLQEVEKRLSAYGLTLERRSHYGIRVVGPEMARRLCLANAAIDASRAAESCDDEATSSGSLLSRSLKEKGLGTTREILSVISRCVEGATSESDFQINSAAYQNLLTHIVVALLRIEEGCYVPMDDEGLKSIVASREYSVAEEIGRRVTQETGIELPCEEIAYIAIHLAGKQTLYDSPGEDNGLVISDSVWTVVTKMLERVWSAFRFDFRNDLELRMNLARHIVPLAVRLRYNMKLTNPLLPDIKTRFPLAYSIAVDASSVLTETYGAKLSADETGYIALAFELALERSKTQIDKKNVLVVCASGAGSARLLEYQCRREFGDYINEVTTCDVVNIGQVDFTHIDYVFTTVPINRELPVPVREVTYFLDSSTAAEARAFLSGSVSSASCDLDHYIKPSLFFPHVAATDKAAVLDSLIGEVERQCDVDDQFRAMVLRREEAAATSFGNNVAMPHPLEATGSDTFVCVGLLDHPVVWDEEGETVQAVFLVSFAGAMSRELRRFIRLLADVLINSQAIERLLQDRSWDVLVSLLTSAQQADASKS